jgi:hypothetical protein
MSLDWMVSREHFGEIVVLRNSHPELRGNTVRRLWGVYAGAAPATVCGEFLFIRRHWDANALGRPNGDDDP